MIDETTGPGGWGVLDVITAAGARPAGGRGRCGLWRQHDLPAGTGRTATAVRAAVKGTTSAYPADALPGIARAYGGRAGGSPCPATAPGS